MVGSLATSSDCTISRSVSVDRLDHVLDRGHRPLGERHQPPRSHPDPTAGRRFPVGVTGQRPGAQVQHPLVLQQPPVADVERLVVDQQPDQLAVGDVDDRLAGLRVAVGALGVRQRAAPRRTS